MAELSASSIPALWKLARLEFDPVRNQRVLLYPEGMVKLNGSAGEIMKRCDGTRPVSAIVEDLEQAFETRDLTKDVTDFMSFAVSHKWLELRE
jgi:pyrroloquinoline quinone biosynthesis protein D